MAMRWKPDEDEILRQTYTDCDIDSLMEKLPGRSPSGIHGRAFQLRLKKSPEFMVTLADSQRKKTEERKTKPRTKPCRTIRLGPNEKRIFIDYANSLSIIELQMLLPRRSRAELHTIADDLGIELLEFKNAE